MDYVRVSRWNKNQRADPALREISVAACRDVGQIVASRAMGLGFFLTFQPRLSMPLQFLELSIRCLAPTADHEIRGLLRRALGNSLR
jgi:hypothetical protein